MVRLHILRALDVNPRFQNWSIDGFTPILASHNMASNKFSRILILLCERVADDKYYRLVILYIMMVNMSVRICRFPRVLRCLSGMAVVIIVCR